MSIKRKFTVEPSLFGLGGQPVREITLNIGNNPPGSTGATGPAGIGATGATGATGFGATGSTGAGNIGATGPAGNPQMEVTASNGSVWGITVSINGILGTTQVSGPVAGSSGVTPPAG